MAEFSLKDTLIGGGLLFGIGVFLKGFKGKKEIKVDSQDWGGDPDGQLAKALAKVREDAKLPKEPLKIEKLDAESFEANSNKIILTDKYTHKKMALVGQTANGTPIWNKATSTCKIPKNARRYTTSLYGAGWYDRLQNGERHSLHKARPKRTEYKLMEEIYHNYTKWEYGPENLWEDGEASLSRVKAKLALSKREIKIAEKELGRKVSKAQAIQWAKKNTNFENYAETFGAESLSDEGNQICNSNHFCMADAEYLGYCFVHSTCERCGTSLIQDEEFYSQDYRTELRNGHSEGFCLRCWGDTGKYGAESFSAESFLANEMPFKSFWLVAKKASKSFPAGQVGELRVYENGERTIVLDSNLIIPFYDKDLAFAYLNKHFMVYPKRVDTSNSLIMGAEDDHDHDHDHENIDELIEKINRVTDFAITFIHDGGFGGEPKGIIVDEELGLRTEIVNYVEGSIDLRLVRDINTNELLSVRFALTGDPDETPILYLPLPEKLTTVPDEERATKEA